VLPRVICYFDDIAGDCEAAFNIFTGELLAIAEFNAANDDVRIAECRDCASHQAIFQAYGTNRFTLHICSGTPITNGQFTLRLSCHSHRGVRGPMRLLADEVRFGVNSVALTRLPATSGPPRTPDIVRLPQHVSNVPRAEEHSPISRYRGR
jgi:hypothetical protein